MGSVGGDPPQSVAIVRDPCMHMLHVKILVAMLQHGRRLSPNSGREEGTDIRQNRCRDQLLPQSLLTHDDGRVL